MSCVLAWGLEAPTAAELVNAVRRIEDLEGLLAEYKLREAVMRKEIELLCHGGAQIFACNL
jgi:hypothetical protein